MKTEAWERVTMLDDEHAHVRTIEIHLGSNDKAEIDLNDLRAILRDGGYTKVVAP